MAPYEKVAESALSIIDQFVDDGDLALKLKNELQVMLLTTKTTGFVDGFVKIMFAFRDLILPLLRPLGAFYLTTLGVDMGIAELAAEGNISAMSVGLTAAFPGWMGSRHVDKSNKQKLERDKVLRGANVTDEDFE